jgi:hypothetical protein
MSGWYDVAQICLNGHMINPSIKTDPMHCQDYCSRCGSITITECQYCKTPIRGRIHYPNVVDFGDVEIPAFCISCGNPYTWTKTKLEAAEELANEIDNLSPDEKQLLSESLAELIKDGPKTQVAAVRFKKLTAHATREITNGLRQILIEIASETAKKAIWG